MILDYSYAIKEIKLPLQGYMDLLELEDLVGLSEEEDLNIVEKINVA
jgi:hypothetical protein